MDLFEEVVRLRGAGRKCALATIVDVRGSIPSYESAKILVRDDGSMTGTIGGGCVEAEVWTAAREVIETEKPKRLTFNLGQDAAYDNGLICGGQIEVFVEPVLPLPRAFIFGGGHISKSLSKVANLAGFATVIVDDRESFAGSKRKVLNVVRELAKEGIPREAFDRLHAPMGLDIGAISPEEIAVSMAAEMIAVRRNAASNWRSLSLSVLGESSRAALAE